MATDQIDDIITEFSIKGDEQFTFSQIITRMAGEISRLRHAHQVQYELERPGGSWVSYYHEVAPQIASVHASELEALRYALDNNHSGVIFLPYGIRLYEALEAKENPQRG